MKKDFDSWNEKKKEINTNPKHFYHEREIWFCSLGVNVGFEQDGTGLNFDRPILVIKGFSPDIFIGLPLTGKKRKGKYYFSLGTIEGREASVILSQIRLIDTKRLVRKVCKIDKETFNSVKIALRKLIFS